jgi:hypothetical protein
LLVCVVRLRPVFRPVIVGCPFSQSSASGSGVWFTCFACLLLHSACGDAQTRHACAGKQDTTRHTKRHTRGSLIQTCSSRRPVMGAHAVKMVPAEANAPRRQLWRQSCFVQANASSLNLEPKRCFDPSQRIQPKP